MALDLPVVPLNIASAASAAPIRQQKDLTPAIEKMMSAYKEGVISMDDMVKHGMITGKGDSLGKVAGDVATSLRQKKVEEITKELQARDALGVPFSGAETGGQAGGGTFPVVPSVTGGGFGGIVGGVAGL